MGNQPASGFSITDQNGNDIANTVQDIDYLQCINITFDQNSRDTQFRVLIKHNGNVKIVLYKDINNINDVHHISFSEIIEASKQIFYENMNFNSVTVFIHNHNRSLKFLLHENSNDNII